MKLLKLFALGAVGALAFVATPASAQATRTWVSGVGDDANPCSRTAPCKTFAGAISKTAAAGEINCLDPGGFGAVTITKSIAIVCDFTEGGVLTSAGTSGVIINAAATDRVFLSGLDFHGIGTALNGIRILAAASVHIQNSTIREFRASSGLGVSIAPSVATQVTITNTTISQNGNGATGGGIRVQPTGAAGTAKIKLDNVRLINNANVGFAIDTTGSTNASGVVALISESSINGTAAGTGAAVDVFQPAGAQGITVLITGTEISNNTSLGLRANGTGTRILLGGSTITSSGTAATQVGGAVINTFGDNYIIGNVSNGTFTLPAVPKA